MDRKFSDQIEKLVHEIVSVPVEDFNLTTKLNRAASFQMSKMESEMGNISSRLDQIKNRESEIEVLRNKLEELLVDIGQMESNVQKLDVYSRRLEEKIKKSK